MSDSMLPRYSEIANDPESMPGSYTQGISQNSQQAGAQGYSPPTVHTIVPRNMCASQQASLAALARERTRRADRSAEAARREAENRERLDAAETAEALARVAAAEEAEGLNAQLEDGGAQLFFAGQDAPSVPRCLGLAFGLTVTRLDISYNSVTSLENLAGFRVLRELIADNNELGEMVDADGKMFLGMPSLPDLELLSLNKNKVANIHSLVFELQGSCPGLQFLSMINNAACPNPATNATCTDGEYILYRQYLLYVLPALRFIDAAEVSSAERSAAVKRFKYATSPAMRPTKDFVDSARRIKEQAKIKLRSLMMSAPNQQTETAVPAQENDGIYMDEIDNAKEGNSSDSKTQVAETIPAVSATTLRDKFAVAVDRLRSRVHSVSGTQVQSTVSVDTSYHFSCAENEPLVSDRELEDTGKNPATKVLEPTAKNDAPVREDKAVLNMSSIVGTRHPPPAAKTITVL